MDNVGSSMEMDGNASGFSASATVSPMLISSIPANAMISPISASSVSTRFKPLYVYTRPIFALRVLSPFMIATCWLVFILPRTIRPTAILPMKLS